MLNKDEIRKNKKTQTSIRNKTIESLNSIESSIEKENINYKKKENDKIENSNNENSINGIIEKEIEYENDVINNKENNINENNNHINNIKNETTNEDKNIEEEKKIETLKTEENKEEEKKEEIKNISYNLNQHLLLKGLLNLGNTCYMNTSIQILLHCQIFINKLTNDPEKPITNSLYNLFNLMTNDSYDKINPIEF